MIKFSKFLVHNRLRIQRGISVVAIFVSAMTWMGVWRDELPAVNGAIVLGACVCLFLSTAWILGYIDEKYLFRIEQSRYAEHNPQLMEILEKVTRIEEKLDQKEF